jgi:methyl-accepting chemotaxis protein
MATPSDQLSRSFLLAGAAIAVALTVGIGVVAGRSARQTLERLAQQRGVENAGRSAMLVGAFMNERRHETEVLAALPAVVAAVRSASQIVAARRLDQLPLADVEQSFSQTRQLGGDPDLRSFLRSYPLRSTLVSVSFTEDHGFNVLASDRPADFGQQDEESWQAAMQDGSYEGAARYDSTTRAVVVDYHVAIRAPQRVRPFGVLRAAIRLDTLGALFASANSSDSTALQVADEQGRLLVSSDRTRRLLEQLSDAELRRQGDSAATAAVRTARGEELVIAVSGNRGRWSVLLRQPAFQAYATARRAERLAWAGALGLLVVTLGMLFLLGRWLDRQVTAPVRAAATITSRVAGGDLTVAVAAHPGDSAETRDLLSSVHAMVAALRRLVGAIRAAADESAAMAAEISAATQQMSASTEEMTATTQDLTKRAAEQAQLVRAAAEDAGRILQIATVLAGGAEDSVRRNTDLATLARHHKGLLDQSIAQLARLAEDVERGAHEADTLAASSAEIQKFVGQAKTVATQTNMLALNAAIEAARAGPQGRGFAVVADEVRKLASLAAAAATETADTVRGVLTRVQATRDRLQRLAHTGAVAREAAQTAAEGLATVAVEAEANDAWSQEIATSAVEVRRLVDEIAARLTAVAQGTDGLLASAQEIAASSEQQSASTQEIASSANQLAEAADRLQGAVKTFRIAGVESPEPPPSAPPTPSSSEASIGPELTPEVAT